MGNYWLKEIILEELPLWAASRSIVLEANDPVVAESNRIKARLAMEAEQDLEIFRKSFVSED